MKRQDKITLALAAGTAAAAMLLASPDAHSNPGDTEDAPSWSCVLDGNHVCGPHNAMGAVPGLYENGRLISSWPVIRTCVIEHSESHDECDDQYVDPKFVRISNQRLTSE